MHASIPCCCASEHSVLKVEDHEIKSAKVLTKEQREEKDRLEEIERKKRESQDDAPERALHDMMNGTLESKRDLSLLEQELLKEPWMEEIPAEEMTDEQLLAVAQFEKKVKLIQSEQETRRKLLQTELSKAKNEVADICRSFDSKTKILAQSRIATHRVIYEHERMIIKLMNDLVQEEEEKEEDQMLRRRIGQLSQQLTTADALLLDFRKLTDVVAKELEILQAEEKSTERSFKRDFQEAGEYVDYLYKLFRSRKQKPQLQSVLNRLNTRRRSSIFRNRRPSQISMSGDGTIDHASAAAAAAATAGTEEENTGGGGGAGDGGMNGDGEGGDGSATDATQTQKERIEGVSPFSAPADKSSEEGFVEVDPSDSPDDLDPEVWMRFIQRRRAQIEKEQQVKKKEIKYQEMQQHLFKLENEAESVHQEILALENQYNQLQSSVLSNSLNAEVMIRVLQGQVEIAESPVVTDMKDCEMIERHTVEDLNTVIKRYGGEKVNILKDITDSKTHINLRKWQKKKLELEHKDRVDLTTELQLLRVTKSLQSLIKMGGHDNQKAAELKRLDRKIEFLNHATREKTMGKKLGLLKIKRKVRTQNKENERLLETVQELEAAVRERLQISAVRADDSQEDRKAQARMKALVTRRKLVDLAKLQNEEIKFLREQVESLRKRTFASFAQPQPAALPNHYELRNANNISRARSRATMSRGSSRGSMYRAQTR